MIGSLLGFFGSGAKSVGVNTTDVSGGVYSPGTATSDYVSVIQIGLIAPITYSWTKVSGSTGFNVSNSSAPTVYFYANIVSGAKIAVWKCTVTDSTGFTADTPNVTVFLEDYRL